MSAPEEAPRALSRWMERPEPEGHLDRQWIAIRERRAAKRRSWLGSFAAMGAVALGAAVAIAFVVVDREPEGATRPAVVAAGPGAVIESAASPIEVSLADGSRIALEPSTRLTVVDAGSVDAPARDVNIELRRGQATFEVARDPGRTFAVAAGNVRVVVTGTRFRVGHSAPGDDQGGERVSVTVERGSVEVHTGHAVLRLGAGETWSGSGGEVEPAVVEEPAAIETEPPARRRPNVRTATELFEDARTARREGRDAAAAEAYEQLLRRHPRDGHAGLAAFELARIRMDVLGDVRGAIDPLERAVAARAFREDAMARLVRAYGETHQRARCTTQRARYLEEFPEGVHRAAVESGCR